MMRVDRDTRRESERNEMKLKWHKRIVIVKCGLWSVDCWLYFTGRIVVWIVGCVLLGGFEFGDAGLGFAGLPCHEFSAHAYDIFIGETACFLHCRQGACFVHIPLVPVDALLPCLEVCVRWVDADDVVLAERALVASIALVPKLASGATLVHVESVHRAFATSCGCGTCDGCSVAVGAGTAFGAVHAKPAFLGERTGWLGRWMQEGACACMISSAGITMLAQHSERIVGAGWCSWLSWVHSSWMSEGAWFPTIERTTCCAELTGAGDGLVRHVAWRRRGERGGYCRMCLLWNIYSDYISIFIKCDRNLWFLSHLIKVNRES